MERFFGSKGSKVSWLALPVLAWVAYAAAFLSLHGLIGVQASSMLLVPVAVTAWFLRGGASGLAAAALMWAIQPGLFWVVGARSALDLVGGENGLVRLSALTVVALGTGLVAKRYRRLQDENAAKDRMVVAVSHEIRNPLAGVLGLAEILSEQSSTLTRQDIAAFGADILAGAKEASALVEDLLTVARIASGRFSVAGQSIELAEMVTSAGHWGSQAPPVTGTARVTADPIRVRQIIRNLLSNAFRHGGPTVEIRIGGDGSTGFLEVIDDGSGVPAAIADRLFDPFVGGDHRESTGIGLSLSLDLARAMGGGLRYARRQEKTIFRLELPAAEPAPIPAPV